MRILKGGWIFGRELADEALMLVEHAWRRLKTGLKLAAEHARTSSSAGEAGGKPLTEFDEELLSCFASYEDNADWARCMAAPACTKRLAQRRWD
jgi:hypothetical protein